MNMRSTDERRARAAEEAAEWMVHLDSERLSSAEREEFIEWLRESPLHVAEMIRMGSAHDLMSEFRGWQGVGVDESARANVVVPLPPRLRSTRFLPLPKAQFRWQPMAALAAAVAAMAVAGAWLFQPGANHIQTLPGEHREIRLADGSLLEVAPGSELHLDLGGGERRVRLDRGQALFQVAKDPNRPFVVAAGKTEVRAVGTAFSVVRGTDSVVVTVAEGRVAVSVANNDKVAPGSWPNSVALNSGQQIAIIHDVLPAAARPVDSKTELGWARGLLIFDGDPVAEVARRFNLSNRTQIRVLDPALAVRPVSGVFAASDPQSFVAFLENAAGATVARRGAQEILVGAPAAQPAADEATAAAR